MSFSQGRALLIGVGSYAHAAWLNVPVTAADAQAVAATLIQPQFCGYPSTQVSVLHDGTANRAAILNALDVLAAHAGEDDTVLIFYAGHGEYGDNGYELTAYDSQFQDGKLVAGSGLHAAELTDKLRAIRARRLLLIVNACHAGEVSPVLGADQKPFTGIPLPTDTAAALLGTGSGRIIMTACREGQVSYIGPGPLTLFTQALIDGLQGKGVSSNRGYISAFDLYTHLYFALDEAVSKQISEAVRQKHHATQEPELTVLKGVGPFAVSLYRGARNLGSFAESAAPSEGTAVREVKPAYAQAMLRQHQQSLSGNASVGAAIAGDVQGDVNAMQQDNRSQAGGINVGNRNRIDSITIGDVAGRDINKSNIRVGNTIKTGDISGSGIAIGHGARSDVRHNTTSGDQFTLAGTFNDAIVNIKSELRSVTQCIEDAPRGDAATKQHLQELINQLLATLEHVPVEHIGDAEAVAEIAKHAVEQATQAHPNQTVVKISAEGLQQAAKNLASTLPTVLPLAQQIAEALRKMIPS